MSYGYSPAYPRVPNPTPQLPTSIRPPIHNPYDKFTQPQFDEWIGGITSALRKALGQEEDETPTSQATQPREEDTHPVSDIGEDNIEDSLAEWKATRTKEKGKMRATEHEQGSEYDSSQGSYEDSDAQDHAAGNTPSDAIELLSDEDYAEGDEVNDPGECNDEDHDGDLVKDFRLVGSGREARQPYVGSSQPTTPSKTHDIFANRTGQEAIEISDSETEDHDQGHDSFDAEGVLFGWEQEEEGDQQPPDIRDPWELPMTYAEDLYTGGPIQETDNSRLSPSNLTPAAEGSNHFDNIDPQLRPSPVLASQPTDHNLTEVSQGSATPALILQTTGEASKGEEASLCDEDIEDILELDTPTTTALGDEPDFISFTALNQPSDTESEQGGPETPYISDNDGGATSENDGEPEEDGFDDGPIPLGTSDLEIPPEHELEEDGGEEFDELEDDDEPVVGMATNPPYGYYGLDASSVAGSGGLDDETGTVGLPRDPPKGGRSEGPDVALLQESTSPPNPHDLVPLPAAATSIQQTDHRLQSTASVVDADQTSSAEPRHASLDDMPTVSDEVVAGNEDDDGSVGDDTILADEAVLTVNEVEEVLRDAFAEADQLVSIANTQEGSIPVYDTNPSPKEQLANTPKSDPRGTTPEVFAEGGPPLDEPAIKKDERTPAEPSPSTVKDKPRNSNEAQKGAPPFIMPLVANPNVRDPMSAPWSPVQSEPSTPVAGLAYLPAVTKFKRDNQLLGITHTNSGLFTPLEGSSSPSPSPSNTATPEDRTGAESETEVQVAEEDEQLGEEQLASVSVSPMAGSPEVPEVEAEVPTGPPESDDWGEIPRLPTPPAEMVDNTEGALPAGPATRVFFQPEQSNNDIGGLDASTETDRNGGTEDGDVFPMVAADTPHKGDEDAPELDGAQPLFCSTTKDTLEVTETDGPLEIMENDSTVAPGAVANNSDDSSIASSSLDEEATPRLKVSEITAPVAKDSQTADPMHPEIHPSPQSLVQTQRSTATLTETHGSPRKRKRSESISIDPEPSGSGSTASGEGSNAVPISIRDGEHREASCNPTDGKPRNNGEEHDSDTESFASSLIAPRNANTSSQDGSRASSVVSERPRLLQGQTPVAEDAPVFHGHGKFKAAMQAIKLLRHTPEQGHTERERETGRAKAKEKDKECPVAPKMGSRKSSGNGSKGNVEAKKPPSLTLPEVPTQPSLPSASTSQSPGTPTSAVSLFSPTVATAPAEAIPSAYEEQTAREPAEPGRQEVRKPVAKAVKRTTTPRKYVPFEPKSTRSQCRYRKISLPREEDGPRVTFCVPQCSLNNKDLMKEEEITDDGLATVRDFERLWDHVEEQNLNPYLIGVIRQLVGLDLLRENEIYYLPTDEEIKRMERRRKRGERRNSRKSIGGAANGEGASAASGLGSISAGPASQPSPGQAEKGKFGPPPSFTESISTTTSMRSKVGRGDSTRSISEGEMSDGDRGGRASKRRKHGGKERDGDGGSRKTTPSVRDDSAGPETATPSQPTTERTPARRSQRTSKKAILVDAQLYRPPVSSGGESSEDELEKAKARRKSARGGTKGLKRRRTEGTVDSSAPPAAGDRDAPLSPRSRRSKRAKIDEK